MVSETPTSSSTPPTSSPRDPTEPSTSSLRTWRMKTDKMDTTIEVEDAFKDLFQFILKVAPLYINNNKLKFKLL